MNEQELVRVAAELAKPFSLGTEGSSASVAAALLSSAGNVYCGVCIDLGCGLGFCAERSAAAEMLKHRETRVTRFVAVDSNGRIVRPCGVCREFLLQVDPRNGEAWVVLGSGTGCTLKELLP